MKSSGIEWIGIIPVDWDIGRIGGLYSLRNTKVSDKDYAPLSVTMKGIVPQLETAAKTNDGDNRKLVRTGDFVINSRSDRRGSCGISHYDGSVSLINTVLTPRDKMVPGYYNWLFHTTNFSDEFYKWGHGIVDDLWTTNWQDMKKIMIPVPPLDEQERIVNFLDEKCGQIDSLIADIQSQIDTLEEYKKSVITEAVTKGLNPDVEMKDSGLPWIDKIPENSWVMKIKYLVSKPITDGTHQTPEYADYDTGSPFLSSKDVTKGYIDWSNIKYITQSLHKKLYKETPSQKGDLLLAKNGTTGVAALVDTDDIFDIYVTLALIRPDTNLILPKYLLYAINCSLTKHQFNEHLIGIGVPNLHLNVIENTKLVIYSINEQQEISDYLDAKCSEIDAILSDKKEQLSTLAEYKKSLIYEYVTGKKEVAAA